MRQIMALVMVLCLMLPGCTAPVEDEIDIFYGQDLPLTTLNMISKISF
ncbi:MAG: hypothetical protein Ct9H90mP16_02460 [Candidatus Poseidoniales archaeon]|nr:MAG: hypothetical protein Ct9H90mP16_02460 [Candidatus Poseidoniales archaeon]